MNVLIFFLFYCSRSFFPGRISCSFFFHVSSRKSVGYKFRIFYSLIASRRVGAYYTTFYTRNDYFHCGLSRNRVRISKPRGSAAPYTRAVIRTSHARRTNMAVIPTARVVVTIRVLNDDTTMNPHYRCDIIPSSFTI